MFKLHSSSGSLPKTSPKTWQQFEIIIQCQQEMGQSLEIAYEMKSELCLRINNLRARLFSDQTLSSNHSFEFLAALIPMLHCICTALYVCEGQYLS